MLLNGVSLGALASQSAVTPAPEPVPENTSAPTISGTEQVGEVLTADPGEWTNDPAGFTYQWQRNDGEGWGDIIGATTSGRLLTEADEGATLRIEVTASNVSGDSEPAYSAATNEVLPAPEDAPVNEELPEITGLLAQGSDLTFDIGIWSGDIDTFEIRVRQTDPNETLLDWTGVTGTTTGTVDTDVGGTLYLDVRATGPGGSTVETSGPFGPIEAAGDEWIVGLVLSSAPEHNPNPAGSPVTWTLVAPNVASNPYDEENGWGFVGTLSDNTTNFGSATRSDPRLVGRNSLNVTIAQIALRVDVPGPGTYIVHAGFSANSSVAPTLDIREGPTYSDPLLLTINDGRTVTTGGGTGIMDAAETVTDEATWASASPYGGEGVEIEVTGSSIWIARPNSNGAPFLNCIAILKKAV